jgi:hypothetical protein
MKRQFFALCVFFQDFIQYLPTQVVIIRHGEKDLSNGQLTPKGQSRAGALAAYLTELDPSSTNPPLLLFGPPQAFFASRPALFSDDETVRCIQTLIPTALKMKLPIHSPYGPHQEQELAQFILNDERYDGKYVLICWHHTLIATLIEAFGYNPPAEIIPSYPNRFDLVWVMPFPAPVPPATLTPVLQELLYGDSNTFP